MLAVMLAESEVKAGLPADLSIAAVNAEAICVVAGSHTAIGAYEEALTARGTGSWRLRTSHAFHSAMVDPVIEPMAEILRQIPLSVPRVPYVSSMTGRAAQDHRCGKAIAQGLARKLARTGPS